MPAIPRLILTCSCEGTMPLDPGAIERAGCGRVAEGATQLCRAQLDRFRAALGEGVPLTVACTQEQPLFEEIAAEAGVSDVTFVNIRETGGWSADARAAGPKAAALIAAAAEEAAPFEVTTMESAGVALILGAGPEAIAAAAELAESLDVTVLLQPGAEAMPPRRTAFPVLQGRVRQARGHLGAFELTVDDYAAPAPSSRDMLRFEAARNGAVSRCDLVVDLTSGQPLFAGDELRPGYFRADPRDPVGVARMLRAASGMVGTFDKPRFINFAADLCAHSRNRQTGCTRCLDLCPTGAILPVGDSVAIDPNICAGCGQCAAACPTGAASYALPDGETLARRLRSLMRGWYAAGGRSAPVILLHDEDHGAALIDAAARFGRGLPAHVVPLLVNELTQVGPEILASAMAYGAGGVQLLAPLRPRHDISGLTATLALMREVMGATGNDPASVALLQADDPDAMEEALWQPASAVRADRSSFLPPTAKRGLLTTAFEEMNRHAPAPAQTIALQPGAPFGAVVVDADACTLCLACVGVCPTGALADNPDRPMVRFTESACVQCGLCAGTCPERAITLEPRIDFAAWNQPRRVLNEEEPACCTACGKAFGTMSSINRVQAKLAGHWMFSGAAGQERLRILSMCEDCRVEAVVTEGFDPHEGIPRPRVRTAEDYRN